MAMMTQSIATIREQIVEAQRVGDHLKVYDLAEAELKLHPGNEFYQYSRSEEHTSELQSLSSISYAVFCL